MNELLAALPAYTVAHLQLSLAALALAAGLSVPLGVAASRRPGLAPALVGGAGVLQTVPSLALLAFMVPLLAMLGAWTSRAFGFEIAAIGRAPALVALTLYGMLPILQNTAAGLDGVEPTLLEASDALGMTPRQRLWRVELPLALPVIVAGVRTAAVWVVGTATLATPVGAPSLGHFIFSGLQTRNYAAVTVGCVASAVLALLIDQSVRVLERGVRERRRGRVAAGLAVLLALALVAGIAFAREQLGPRGRTVVIGAKNFSEQFVLSEILARALAAGGGLEPRVLGSLGSTVLFDALRSGEIDTYVDYSGTLWANVLGRSGTPPGRAAVLEEVRRSLRDDYGVVVAAALGFENAYALAMRADRARALGIETVGDLARHARALELGADYEFLARPEWRALEQAYGLSFRATRSMDPSLMYRAVADGQVDVISAFSTDGRIAAFDLVVLRDERGVIPPYDALVLVGPALARDRPAAVARLAALEGTIDADTMRRMNLAVDREGRSPAEVAADWWRAHEEEGEGP